jgi:hypothetical protein
MEYNLYIVLPIFHEIFLKYLNIIQKLVFYHIQYIYYTKSFIISTFKIKIKQIFPGYC